MPAGDNPQERLKELHERFARNHLRGLWQREGAAVAPPGAAFWPWSDLQPVLEQSLKLVRLPEDTDQRVIGLNAPGMSDRAVSLGYQLLNPGENVASHRHTPAQMRFVVEGTGACTTAEGERMFMEPGDLLVQPNWTWHGTSSIGEGPCLWLDIQDRNLVNYLGAFVRELWPGGEVQPETRPEDYHRRLLGMLRPAQASSEIIPPIRYKWSDTLKALEQLMDAGAADPCDGVAFEYTNPLTGGHTLPTLSAQIQVLRPGEETSSHRHTGTAVYHVVEGEGATLVDGAALEWRRRDCFMIPGLQWHSHRNASRERAILFTVSDRPALEALALYREERR